MVTRISKRTNFTFSVKRALYSGAVLSALILSACGAKAPAPATSTEEAAQVSAGVSATGVVLPPEEAMLSFQVAGTVVELAVKEGDTVKKGDVLARMDTRQLDASVVEAEAALAIANASLDKAKTGPRPEEIEQAKHDVAASQASVAQAVAQLDAVKAGASQAEILQAEADLQSAFLAQKIQQDRYNVANGTAINASPAFQDLLPKGGQKIDPEAVEDEGKALDVANMNLAAAQAYLDKLKSGAEPSDVSLANAQVWVSSAEQAAQQAYLNLLMAGPRSENIAVSKAQVDEKEAAVNSARASRDKAILKAPFDGVLSEVNIRQNEWANPGQQIAIMASGGPLEVETTDLNEIDVARIKEGDPVTVTFDALPGISVTGKVLSIAPRASEGAGVNYPVRISLDEVPDALRWGMTAFVDIEVDQ